MACFLTYFSVFVAFPSQTIVDAYLQPTVDESKEPFSWGLPNLDLIRESVHY